MGQNQLISQCLSNPNGKKGKETQFLISHMHDSGKRLTILTVKEIQALYGLPQFTDEERGEWHIIRSNNVNALITSIFITMIIWIIRMFALKSVRV